MRVGRRGRPWALVAAAALLWAGTAPVQVQAQEPPPLPPGLGGEVPADEAEVHEEEGAGSRLEVQGFAELRAGGRLQEDPHEDAASLGELRLQTTAQRAWRRVTLRATADLLFDALEETHEVRLERGEGALDLREAWVFWRAASALELKAGRQVLTWGTGDLLFINDLFPKDWQSFFLGRDPEYLKAPADAVKVSAYGRAANLDLVYSPPGFRTGGSGTTSSPCASTGASAPTSWPPTATAGSGRALRGRTRRAARRRSRSSRCSAPA